MHPITALQVIGQPQVPDSYFLAATLDVTGQQIFDGIGTDPSVGSTDGLFKEGFYGHHYSTYGMDWAENGVNNFERIKYTSPDQPHPDSWRPFYMDSGDIVMRVAPIDPGNSAEVAWARNKTYHLMPNGDRATAAFFTAANGFSGGVPTDWGTVQTEPDGALLFYGYPMLYKGPMLSTYGNRHRMGKGKRVWRGTIPAGAGLRPGGDILNVNDLRAVFAALGWDLQDFPLGKGVNGEDTANPATTTYVPHSDGPEKPEIDTGERFGASKTDLHATVHFYNDSVSIQQINYTLATGIDLTTNKFTCSVVVGPELISFAFNDTIFQVVATPDEVKNPLPIYETVSGEEYNVVRDANGFGVKTGELQRNADGSPRYMQFAQLMNIAMDGKYPRDLARQVIQAGGILPDFTDSPEMRIEYMRCLPLGDGAEVVPDTTVVVPGVIGKTVVTLHDTVTLTTDSTDAGTWEIPATLSTYIEVMSGALTNKTLTFRYLQPVPADLADDIVWNDD